MMSLAGLSMSSIVAEQTSAHTLAIADKMAGVLFSAVWEGAVLVAVVALTLQLIPRLSAALRARLWLAVLAILVVLPALLVVLPGAFSHVMLHPLPSTELHPLQVSAVWSVWLACTWVVLSLGRAVKLASGALRLRQIARGAVPVHSVLADAALLRHASRSIELCVSAEIGRPSVVGFFRPRILLPPALFAALSPEELRQVILHEMEHLRRRDDWTNLAQKLALVALPLNPALFWVERRLCAERELACDDSVLRACTNVLYPAAARKAYAACLVSLAEHAMVRRGAALALGAWEGQSELARRVHRILRRPEPTLRPATSRLAVGGVLGGVLVGGALLAGSPQLVRFAPDPAVAIASAELPAAVLHVGGDSLTEPGRGMSLRAMMHPVVAHVPSGQPHMTLASAVFPMRVGALLRPHRDLPRNETHRSSMANIATAGPSFVPLRVTNPARRIHMPQATSPQGANPLRRVSSPQQARQLPQVGSLRKVSYNAGTPDSRVVLMTAWSHAEQVLTLRVDTCSFDAADEEFSPSYAAVPLQGGWLLIQL